MGPTTVHHDPPEWVLPLSQNATHKRNGTQGLILGTQPRKVPLNGKLNWQDL